MMGHIIPRLRGTCPEGKGGTILPKFCDTTSPEFRGTQHPLGKGGAQSLPNLEAHILQCESSKGDEGTYPQELGGTRLPRI